MKFLKSRLVIGAFCMVIAAILAFVILPKAYESKADTVMVLTSAQTITAGTTITNDMLQSVEVGGYGLPNDVVLAEEKEEILGMVAGERIYSGEYLWQSRLLTTEAYDAETTDKVEIPEGKYLVAVAFPSTSSAIAGVLRADAIVDAYQVKESTVNGQLESHKILPNLEVNRVLNSSLQSLDELDAVINAEDYDNTQEAPNFMPAYVIFEVDEAQANLLIQMEREGSLHLALVRAGDAS